MAAFLSNATWQASLNNSRKRAAVVIAEPKDCLEEVFRQRFGVEYSYDFFGFKTWLGGLGGDYAKCGIFSEWNFDNLANLEWLARGVS